MALFVNNITGSNVDDNFIGVTGSVKFGDPGYAGGAAGSDLHLPSAPQGATFFVSGAQGSATHGMLNKRQFAVFGGDLNVSGAFFLGERHVGAGTSYAATQLMVGGAASLGAGLSTAGMHLDDVLFYAATGSLHVMMKNGKQYALLSGSDGNTPAGGSNTQVQYNNGGSLGGVSNMTTDGTNVTKLVTDATAAITLESSFNDASAISMMTNAGTSERITVTNTQGNNASAIKINAAAGGIDIDSALATNLTAEGTMTVVGNGGASLGDDTGTWEFDGAGAVTETGMTSLSVTPSGAITLTAGAASTWSASTGDLTVDATAGSLNLTGGEADAAAVRIQADNAAGGIDVDAGTGGIAVDTTGAFSVDGAAASNITVASDGADENLTISVTGATASSLILESQGTGTDSIDMNAVGGIDIDSAAGITIDAVAAFSINGADDSDVTVSTAAKDLALTVSGGGAQVLQLNSAGTGTDAIDINATAGGMDVDVAGALSIDANDDSDITVSASAKDLTIGVSGGGAQVLKLDSAGTGADAIDINATAGGIQVDSSGAIAIESSGGTISIGADAVAQAISVGTGAAARTITMGNVTGATALAFNAGTGGIALASTGTGDITLDSDDTLLLDADGVLELNSSAGAISIGNDDVAQAINIGTNGNRTITIGEDGNTSSGVVVRSEAGLTLDAGSNNITVTAGSIIPSADEGVNLGSDSVRFGNIYTGDLHLCNDRGNWTLVEENSMITFRNNYTGKWFRMVMEEIDPTGRDAGMKGVPPRAGDDDVEWEI
tara:strand:- start:317 stop:2659 length:2343 start_codon:yes stop_codon:yes gene_type:complete